MAISSYTVVNVQSAGPYNVDVTIMYDSGERALIRVPATASQNDLKTLIMQDVNARNAVLMQPEISSIQSMIGQPQPISVPSVAPPAPTPPIPVQPSPPAPSPSPAPSPVVQPVISPAPKV